MSKIKDILGCFFAVVAVCLLIMYCISQKRIHSLESQNSCLKNDNDILRQNNELFKRQIERANNDKMELGRKNKELEDSAKRDISFDWNFIIADTDIVRWLHENAIRVQGSRARAD